MCSAALTPIMSASERLTLRTRVSVSMKAKPIGASSSSASSNATSHASEPGPGRPASGTELAALNRHTSQPCERPWTIPFLRTADTRRLAPIGPPGLPSATGSSFASARPPPEAVPQPVAEHVECDDDHDDGKTSWIDLPPVPVVDVLDPAGDHVAPVRRRRSHSQAEIAQGGQHQDGVGDL